MTPVTTTVPALKKDFRGVVKRLHLGQGQIDYSNLKSMLNKVTAKMPFFALIVAFVAIGMLAITAMAAKKENVKAKTERRAANQWYQVTISGSNPNLTSNQLIQSELGEQPNDDDCNASNSGNPCAVELSFPTTVPPISPGSATVQQAISMYGASVVGYTRQP